MELTDLIRIIQPRELSGPRNGTLLGLCYDSRRVMEGDAFFALPGSKVDGRRFVTEAMERGARIIVAEEAVDVPAGVTALVVDDARLALARVAAEYFGHPTRGVPVVGVTGTNGKTTVTYLLEAIMQSAGYRPAVLGTVNYRFEKETRHAPHTTPEAIDLLRTFSDFRALGADALIVEVSSHALAQHRVAGVEFTVGVFTNLTPEHLDYHREMESYFAAKRSLFSDLLPQSEGIAVINRDDPFGARLATEFDAALTCGTTGTVRLIDADLSLSGITGMLQTPAGETPLNSRLLGEFNRSNIECAAAAACALDIDPPTIAVGISRAPQVPGRLERIDNPLGAEILVDYAHTGDALEQVLRTLRKLEPRRLLVVFGCGGDRDRAKRPVMGKCAASHADLAILTSDNPRTEDPLAIIVDVREGIKRVHRHEWSPEKARNAKGTGYVVIPDRRDAIRFGVDCLQAGDLLLIAGKGHEDYQTVGTENRHFDDREEARAALNIRERNACS